MEKRLLPLVSLAVGLSFAATPATHATTTLPCHITVNGTGYNNGTLINMNAGDRIVFGGVFSRPARTIGGGSVTYTTTYQWATTGGEPIAGYSTGSTGEITYLQPSDLVGIGFTCYFLKPSTYELSTPEVTVTCNITGSDGSSYIENGYLYLNISKPMNVPITATCGSVVYTDTPGAGLLGQSYSDLKFADPSGVNGIFMSANLGKISGNFCWIQILHKYNLHIGLYPTSTLTADPALDGGFPYPNSGASYSDTPEVGATDSIAGITALSIEISATGWLLWNDGTPGAIWVPLASEDWYGLGQEQDGQIYGTEPYASNYQGNLIEPPTWVETFTP